MAAGSRASPPAPVTPLVRGGGPPPPQHAGIAALLAAAVNKAQGPHRSLHSAYGVSGRAAAPATVSAPRGESRWGSRATVPLGPAARRSGRSLIALNQSRNRQVPGLGSP